MWNIELYLGPLYPTSRLLQHIIISTLLSLPLALYKGRIYPRLYTLLGSDGIFPFPTKSHMVCVLYIISLKWFPSLATRLLADSGEKTAAGIHPGPCTDFMTQVIIKEVKNIRRKWLILNSRRMCKFAEVVYHRVHDVIS